MVDSMTDIDPSCPPVVCTLDSQALAERCLEWSDLAALAVDAEPIPTGVRSTFPAGLRSELDDLVAREQQCCGSWMKTRLTAVGELVQLELTTDNPDGIEVIRGLVAAQQLDVTIHWGSAQ